MAAKAHITRRAAIVGAVASTAALAVPAAAEVTEKKAKALLDWSDQFDGVVRERLIVEARLRQLASDFVEAAKQIDTTITGAWLGTETTCPESSPAGDFQSVYFERKGSEFLRSKRNRHN